MAPVLLMGIYLVRSRLTHISEINALIDSKQGVLYGTLLLAWEITDPKQTLSLGIKNIIRHHKKDL